MFSVACRRSFVHALSSHVRHFSVTPLKDWASAVMAPTKHDFVVLYFTSKRSGVCKTQIAPMMDEISGLISDVHFFSVDIDRIPESVEKANITVVPTAKVYVEGRLINTFKGPRALMGMADEIGKGDVKKPDEIDRGKKDKKLE